MRIAFLIAVIMFLKFGRIHAQASVYHHFPDSGFAWMEEFTKSPNGTCCCTSSICTSYFSYQHFLTSDTIVNGLRYMILFESGYMQNTNSGPTICQTGEFATCYVYFNDFECAWIREDSLAKQVYIVMPDSAIEELLYDFNMQLGDTVRGMIGRHGNYCSHIDSVQVAGDFHRRFWLTSFGGSQLGYDSAYATITEGLGGSQGVMMPIHPVDSSFGVMLCAYDQQVPVWPSTQTGCPLPLGNAGPSLRAQMEISPNPIFDGETTITIHESGMLYIRDIQGRYIRSYFLNEGPSRISLRDLSPGYYTIQFTSFSGCLISSKLIVP